jgi:hypothetical protein
MPQWYANWLPAAAGFFSRFGSGEAACADGGMDAFYEMEDTNVN